MIGSERSHTSDGKLTDRKEKLSKKKKRNVMQHATEDDHPVLARVVNESLSVNSIRIINRINEYKKKIL